MKLSLPKWLLPSLATLMVVGGSVAVAGALDGSDPVVNEPEPTTLEPTTTTLVPDPAPDAEAPADEESDSPDRYWGPECGDGDATNHGGYVSSSDKGGAARSEAAHSPCGKPTADVPPVTDPPQSGGDDSEVDDDEGAEVPDDEGTEAPDDQGTSDDGSGNSEGHGPH